MVKQLVPPYTFQKSVDIILISVSSDKSTAIYFVLHGDVVSHSFYACIYEQGIKIFFLTLTFSLSFITWKLFILLNR